MWSAVKCVMSVKCLICNWEYFTFQGPVPSRALQKSSSTSHILTSVLYLRIYNPVMVGFKSQEVVDDKMITMFLIPAPKLQEVVHNRQSIYVQSQLWAADIFPFFWKREQYFVLSVDLMRFNNRKRISRTWAADEMHITQTYIDTESMNLLCLFEHCQDASLNIFFSWMLNVFLHLDKKTKTKQTPHHISWSYSVLFSRWTLLSLSNVHLLNKTVRYYEKADNWTLT